ncbi:MAG TPA: class I SAM-dependent methyltransferase [Kofleriaceae bacterium]
MTDRPLELAKNGAAHLLAEAEAALTAGEIDEAEWYRRVAASITSRYLAADTPWAQSGRSGDAASFEYARSLLVDAMRPGTFLDVGCASGYLMERMVVWCVDAGIACEPYGLDIAAELAELARTRLPHWRDRIFVGNAIDWQAPQRFDVVRTGLEYVPLRRQRDFVARLLADVVADGGRLVIGVFNEERDVRAYERELASWGFAIAGRAEREHRDPRLAYRAVWIDR